MNNRKNETETKIRCVLNCERLEHLKHLPLLNMLINSALCNKIKFILFKSRRQNVHAFIKVSVKIDIAFYYTSSSNA